MSQTDKERAIAELSTKCAHAYGMEIGGDLIPGEGSIAWTVDAAYDAGYRAAKEDAAIYVEKRQIKIGWNIQQDKEAAAEIRKLKPEGQ